jgi:probable rRNA maturation factor
MLDVLCEPDGLVPVPDLRQIRIKLGAISRLIERDEMKSLSHVTVLLVSTERICELHDQFFDDPSPTDVITFPADDDACSTAIEGDIAICVEVAREQAQEANHDSWLEIVFLGVHGLLHLSGWMDSTAAERERMIARQYALMHEAAAGRGACT